MENGKEKIDQSKVVEVEVTEEKIDPAREKPIKPKSPRDDYHKKIDFYSRFSYLGLRYGPTGLILSLLASLVFAILDSQNDAEMYRIVAIICYSLTGIFLLLSLLGLGAYFICKHYMGKDPNYSDRK